MLYIFFTSLSFLIVLLSEISSLKTLGIISLTRTYRCLEIMNVFDRKTQTGAVAYFRNCLKNGDVKEALSCFDAEGVYIDRDGTAIRGLEAIGLAMVRLCALKLEVKGGKSHVTVVNDLALWLDQWEMTGNTPDGNPIKMTGHTSCLMKRNEEGIWLWMVDNPFGPAVLEG